MLTTYTLLAIAILLLIVLIVMAVRILNQSNTNSNNPLVQQIETLHTALSAHEKRMADEFTRNRKEWLEQSGETRRELSENISRLAQTNADKWDAVRKTLEDKLNDNRQSMEQLNRDNRTELHLELSRNTEAMNNALEQYKNAIRDLFAAFETNQKQRFDTNHEKIEALKVGLEASVKSLQEGNERKLEEMRRTVDEKLNETLEKRLGESFKQVSDRLEAVHKGLGEMQNLAVSVGDLKKVMSNVKTRGILGEYQLQQLLEDLLTNEQYAKNVKTKIGSGAVVEFAIKMPHGQNLEKTLWLPIDSKFPKEDYEALVDAYEQADNANIELYRKAFINAIKKNAKEIQEKYIDPPNTTEYGIMFLPFESLFGEVLRVPGLFEQLQREYKITVTGPTTLSALLNSLQMGFRTLAIEKRSSEVWDLLGAVKTEFGKFGGILEKTRDKLIAATKDLDSTGVRSRAIERKLREVQALPVLEDKPLFDDAQPADADAED